MVTGASGDFGSCIVPEILGRGHDVVGLSRHPHTMRSSRYVHVAADIRNEDEVTAAMAGVDAVVHLAWTTHPLHDAAATRSIDIGGTKAVIGAMERAGVRRLVTASSVMAYGANVDNPARLRESDALRPSAKHVYSRHKAEAEGIVAASSVDALMVRATNIMGRSSTGVTQEGFAAPFTFGMKGAGNEMQFIHPDDLGRFFADALEHPEWLGPVNLAADGTATMAEIARILGKRYVEFPPKQAAAVLSFLWDRGWFSLGPGEVEALVHLPLVDTGLLTDEFNFHCAWTSRECVSDFARTNRDHVFLGRRKVSVPWRWPWGWVPPPPEENEFRQPASKLGVAGEFDTTVDPAWPVYTAANTSEAFPGPMTPLSLELSLEALRAGGSQAADVLRLDGDLRRVLSEEATASFGHSVYANLSVIYAMGAAMPGAGTSAWEDMLFGAGAEVPDVDKPALWTMARRLPFTAGLLTGFAREIRDIDANARANQRDSAYFADLKDAQLHARLLRVRDEIAHGWAGSGQATAFVVPVMSLVQKLDGSGVVTQIRGGTEKLLSAGVVRGAYALADKARADGFTLSTLRGGSAAFALKTLRRERPRFIAELDALIAEFGHRGPGECELSNRMFADSPARLLEIVSKIVASADRPVEAAPVMGLRLRIAAGLAGRAQRLRERVRDATIRQTHQYRLIARELGSRLVQRGVLDEPDDAFYLVRAELKNPPADVKSLVSRRRAERARLEIDRPPLTFVERWQPQTGASTELAAGESLQGVGVSSGVAKGPVRVLTVESLDDLEPGEVLVAAFTDTGWTPFFAYAAAVVVDTGGEMSHAAVVAREFGIPCVVATSTGSRALHTGDTVEVDGTTGAVTRVE
jgi:nucleoside-diphosphate-sugar epimerase/phosphohistidine swiveling domain-containing protein